MKFAVIVIATLLAAHTNASPLPDFSGIGDGTGVAGNSLDATELESKVTTTGVSSAAAGGGVTAIIGQMQKMAANGDWTKGLDPNQFIDLFKIIWEQFIQVYIIQGITTLATAATLSSIPGGIPGGNLGGLPGGVPGGTPGGAPGGTTGDGPGGTPEDVPGGTPGDAPGDASGDNPGIPPGSLGGSPRSPVEKPVPGPNAIPDANSPVINGSVW